MRLSMLSITGRPLRHAGRSVLCLALIMLCLSYAAGALASMHVSHAISMYGDAKYAPDFSHFDYVNPEAPKGGTLKLHAMGGFDSFMPWLPKGTAASGLGALGNSYLFDSLTVQSMDEPFTEYGLVAKTIEWPDDRSWVAYELDPRARFADDTPITADDVVWTFNTLMSHGAPFYAYYYDDVEAVEAVSPHKVKFTFKPGDNRELVMIIGQLPILPKHYWETRSFDAATLEPPLGSGPYAISSFKAGKRVVFTRRDDYWAKDLPVMRGHYNFDRIIYDYYLDETVALQAFIRGDYDWRAEPSSRHWAKAYNGKRFTDGTLTKEAIKHQNSSGMQAFVFNTRRPVFQDSTLREAMAYAFDFEWANRHLFFKQYKRTRSYFQNSELEARGQPDAAELKLLEPLRDALPERVFTQAYAPPVSDGSGRPRKNLLHAQAMLRDAGYTIKGDQLYTPDGIPVRFEFLLSSPLFERVVLPFARNLKALGIQANVVRVDESQYVERMRHFDFDMAVAVWGQSASPGNEQRGYWGSASAERPSSRNYAGIQSDAIDTLIDTLIRAGNRRQLVTATHALDRVLQWGFYVIPNWYTDVYRFAYNTKLKHPENMPQYLPYDGALDLWWAE